MPPRRSFEQQVQELVRATTREPGGPTSATPTRRRPALMLSVQPPAPGSAPTPEPGTVTIENRITRLWVGDGWRPPGGGIAACAEQLLGLHAAEIAGTSDAATTDARKRLRTAWRLGDLLASGSPGAASKRAIQQLLDSL